MKQGELRNLTPAQLVKRFENLALEQDKAELGFDTAEVNRIYWQLDAIKNELKSREGDQRHVLLALYEHPNPQVRLKAAKATLAIAPQEGRAVLQAIVDAKIDPQRLEAGMSLWNLETGVYKPT
jgi:cytochrome c oxidase assembly protein Cox11